MVVVVVGGTVVVVSTGATVDADVVALITAVVGVATVEPVDPPPDGMMTNVVVDDGTEIDGAEDVGAVAIVVVGATVVVVDVVVVVVGATLYTPKLKTAADVEDAPFPLSTRRAVMV